MKIYIVVFRSRTNVMRFVDKMRGNGYAASVIPLPKDIQIGCGLCAKINGPDVKIAFQVVNYYRISGFYGVYSVEKNGLRSRVNKLY